MASWSPVLQRQRQPAVVGEGGVAAGAKGAAAKVFTEAVARFCGGHSSKGCLHNIVSVPCVKTPQ